MNSAETGRTALHPDQALSLVLEGIPEPTTTLVPLDRALGRAMPRELFCLVDQPPFDKSGMDGFAFCPAAIPTDVYPVTETLAAGVAGGRALDPGSCARIMTGAPVPAGAVAVQRVEWTEAAGTAGGREFVRFLRPETVSNIIRRGENQKRGDLLLSPRVLAAQDIGILASSGYAEVAVARRPIVGILSTGDEIIAPGQPLAPGAIYDSNGPQLCAQAVAAGCEALSFGIVRDEEEPLRLVLREALEACDVVIVSGGVSMGDFDFVPAAFKSLGIEPVFHGLAMRPGKPTFFGRLGGRDSGKTVFGMPGNPVSTFVNFEVLVRPHLAARAGITHAPRMLRARLSAPLARRGSDRVEFLPAVLSPKPEGLGVAPLAYHGSSMLGILAAADCLLRMEIGVERIEAGEVVDVRLLRA